MKTYFDYVNVIEPKIFTICGIQLKPFSLGHYLLLEKLQNPFLTDNPNFQIDLVNGIYNFYFALIICGHSYEENVELLNNEKELKRICNKISKHIIKVSKKEKGWNIWEKIVMFKQYIRYFSDIPNFTIENQSNSAASGIDWKQNLFTIAKSEWGYTDTEILNMPLSRLFYEWCSFAEKNGSIHVLNHDEMEQVESIRQEKLNASLQNNDDIVL